MALRDLSINVGINADSSPLADLNRRFAQLNSTVRGADSSVQQASRNMANMNRGVIRQATAFNNELNRQNDIIRQLARTSGTTATQMASDWRSMSVQMRRDLIQNHNAMAGYRQQLMENRSEMMKLGRQMGNYAGSTNDFMSEVRRLGKEHKKINDQMINSNVAMRQSMIEQVAIMSAMSGQSEKISANYERMGNTFYNVNRPLLSVTSNLERMARNGNAAQLALQTLGPNASMKELMDMTNMINQGIMRQQMLLMVMGTAWIGFTAILANAALGPDPAEVRAQQAELTEAYTKEWQKRVDEIAHFVNIFEQVSVPKVSKTDVMNALQSQLDAMKTFRSSLQSLTQKGVDQGLIQELQKAGPAAATEIKRIDQMSRPELDKYVGMWREKMQLARTQATDELSQLKQDTDKQIKSLQDSLKPLGIAWEEFKNTWAVALAPFVDFWGQIASYVVRAGTMVGRFVQKLNEISPWITKIAGMFIYLTTTFIVLLSPLAVGIGLLGGMSAAFSALWMIIGPFVVGLASVAGTAMLVAGGLIALGAALYLAWTRSETFRNIVISGWQAIKNAALAVWGFLKPYIMQAIAAVQTFVQQKMQQLKTFWDQNGQQILQAAQNIWGFISTIIGGAVRGIWSVMQFVWPLVVMLIQSVWNNIKGIINGALNIIMGLVKVFAGLFTGDFSKMWEGIKQIFFGAIQVAWNYVNLLLFGKILSAGRIFVVGFRDVLVGMWTFLKNLFFGSVNAVRNTVQSGFTAMKLVGETLMTGFKNTVTGIWTALHGSISGILGRIGTAIRTAWTSVRTEMSSLLGMIKKDVSGVFEKIVGAAKDLPGKMGAAIKAMAGGVGEGLSALGNKIFSGFGKIVNGAIGGLNWVLGKIGVDTVIKDWKVPKYAKGTNFHPGGPAILGDGGGPELYRTPAGQVGMSPGTDTLMNLPKGTQVLSHKQTQALMNSGMPAYAKGNTTINNFMSGVQNTANAAWQGTKNTANAAWQGTKNVASDAWEGTKNAAGAVKDLAIDVWEYASNPGELMSKVFNELGVTFPKIGGAWKDIGPGSVKYMRGKMADYVKKQFDAFGGSGGGGYSFPSIFRKTSNFGMRNGKMHKGIDLAAPANTPIPSQSAGPVIYSGFGQRGSGYGGYGNVVHVGSKSGLSYLYGHNTRNLVKTGDMVQKGQIIGTVGNTGDSRGNHLHFEIRQGNKAMNPDGFGGAFGGASGNVKAWIQQAIAATGVPRSWASSLETIAMKESNGNPRAYNGWDINAKRGIASRGLMQTIPPTFNAYKQKGMNDIFNPVHNAAAAINYIKARYGTVFNTPGIKSMARGGPYKGYAKGTNGPLSHSQWAWVGEQGPELMRLNRGTEIFSHPDSMDMISGRYNPSGSALSSSEDTYNPSSSSVSSSGGKEVNINYSPTVNVNVSGASGDTNQQVKEQVQKALDEQYQKLLALFKSGEEY
jgi:SLT domain-containing protein/phage-related protein